MADDPRPDDHWNALFKIVEAHHQQASEQHTRLRLKMSQDKDQILAAIAMSRKQIDSDISDHETWTEQRIDKMRGEFVLRVEFIPIRNGFYGMCMTFFLGFVGFVWKVLGKQ